jgi:hypothetical protein
MPLVTGSPQFRGSDETTDLLPRRLGRGALVVGALAGAALLGGVFSVVLRRPPPPAPPPSRAALQPETAAVERLKPAAPPPRHIDLTTIPPEAGVSIDNGSPWTGQLHTTIPADGESHVIRVWAQGYEPRTISFGPDDAPPAQIRLDPLPKSTASARKAKISHQPVRTQTFVEPSNEGPKGPKRGANDAFILE